MTETTRYIEGQIRQEMPSEGPRFPPMKVEGMWPFRTRVWSESFSEVYEPREGWWTSVRVVITRSWYGRLKVSVIAEDGCTEFRRGELARQAIAWVRQRTTDQ